MSHNLFARPEQSTELIFKYAARITYGKSYSQSDECADILFSNQPLSYCGKADTSQGNPQLLTNISACLAIAETLVSTLGPRGMDKLIVSDRAEAQITNDGATILKLLDIVHLAARTLVDIARARMRRSGMEQQALFC